MEPSEIYTSMIQSRGAAYRESQIVSWSHYHDPIDHSAARPAGNSRAWGDASPEAQSRVIDALIASSERAGLRPREAAYVLAIARVESGFNLDAAAGTTSATGLGQFIDKTGASYGINDGNRGNLRMQADALVAHYQENAALARARGHGDEYIYEYHHDGPSGEYGGLSLALREVMPYLDRYEAFVRTHEQKYGVTERGPSLAQRHDAPHRTHGRHAAAGLHGLEEGAQGQQVHDLQVKLSRLGYLDSSQIDSTFGIDTRHALERFQDDHEPLIVDGKAGKNTLEALDAALKAHDKAQSQTKVTPDKVQGVLMSDPHHPDHTLYEQALAGVRTLHAHGQPTEQQCRNLAAALVVEARHEGFARIDQVAHGDGGNRVYIAQHPASPMEHAKFGSVDTGTALQTPVARSSDLAAAIPPPSIAPPVSIMQTPANNTITTSQQRIPFIALAIALPMLVALTLPAGVAHAQDAAGQDKAGASSTRASYAACLAAAAGVTPDMKQCMGTEYTYQDKRLNKAYKALMATLDKDRQTKLRTSERTWITYRNSHCALDPNGGQAAELDAYDCSVQETARQASALETRLHKAH